MNLLSLESEVTLDIKLRKETVNDKIRKEEIFMLVKQHLFVFDAF